MKTGEFAFETPFGGVGVDEEGDEEEGEEGHPDKEGSSEVESDELFEGVSIVVARDDCGRDRGKK